MSQEVEYDVFLSHNRADKVAVEVIGQRLRQEAGLAPFLDKWHLIPGRPWMDDIEKALAQSLTVAVFVGPSGISPWHNEEMRAALDEAVRSRDEARVIPVLLPGAREEMVSRFLARRAWVDFRPGLDDAEAFQRLVAGIKGEAIVGGAYELPDEPAPYRGLLRFEAEHARFFFGREADRQRLVEKLDQVAFVAVVGASGSGKSSLVRAGVLPALAGGALPRSREWQTLVFQPGSQPLRTLAEQVACLVPIAERLDTVDGLTRRLTERADGLRTAVTAYLAERPRLVLLVIDQFEELFTLCRETPEVCRGRVEQFIANLADAEQHGDARIRILVTLRADFLDRCLGFAALRDLLQDRQMLLGPMDEPALREAIVRPAQEVGAFFEKGLVSMILRDVEAEPGALPLLQVALYELWQARRGPWLTIDAYEASGGVRGALQRRAQATYESLTAEQQAIARNVLLRLTALGEGVADTRRRVERSELYPVGIARGEVDAVLQVLSGERARLVVADEESAEVAHEALIQGWATLRAWLDEDRDLLRLRQEIGRAADDWRDHEGEERYLLHQDQELARAETLELHPRFRLNDLERTYIQACRALQDSRHTNLMIRVLAQDEVAGDDSSAGYPVEAQLADGSFFSGHLNLVYDELRRVEHDTAAYGRTLATVLFSGQILEAYTRAEERARWQTDGRLRVQLWINERAAELHRFPWEALDLGQELGERLAATARTPFSRYVGLPIAEPELVQVRPIRLLFAVSDPKDLERWGLKPIDVLREVANFQQALGDLAEQFHVTLLLGRAEPYPGLRAQWERQGYRIKAGPTSRENLLRLMSQNHMVHFVGHGRLSSDGEIGALFLEDEDGSVKVMKDEQLAGMIRMLYPMPHLMFLAAGQSAQGVAPRLLQAGMPAIVGLGENLPLETVECFTHEFYRRLLQHGIVDRAANEARASALTRRLDGWERLILHTRLPQGRLFSPLPSLPQRQVRLRQVGGDAETGRDTDLLIRISPKGEDGDAYPVEAVLDGGSPYSGWLQLDMRGLLEREIDAIAYGHYLAGSLLSGRTLEAYQRAAERARRASGGHLRVRLQISDGAPELGHLHWEALHLEGDLAGPLAASERTTFSRYPNLQLAEPHPIQVHPIRLLFAVSKPKNLDEYNLAPIDVQQQVDLLLRALAVQAGSCQVTLLPGCTGLSPALEALVREQGARVEAGPTSAENLRRLLSGHHIVHLLCQASRHSEMGHSLLALEDDDGFVEPMGGADLVSLVKGLQSVPHLMLLVFCESARGVAPELVEAGVPAVVGLSGLVSMETADRITSEFYSPLLQHGLLDRALNDVRRTVLGRDLYDWDRIVLYSRLPGGRLFVPMQLEQ